MTHQIVVFHHLLAKESRHVLKQQTVERLAFIAFRFKAYLDWVGKWECHRKGKALRNRNHKYGYADDEKIYKSLEVEHLKFLALKEKLVDTEANNKHDNGEEGDANANVANLFESNRNASKSINFNNYI